MPMAMASISLQLCFTHPTHCQLRKECRTKAYISTTKFNDRDMGVISIESQNEVHRMNAEASSLCREGRLTESLKVIELIGQRGFGVEGSYAHLLGACADMRSLPIAEEVHTHMLQNGIQLSVPLAAKLINTYVKCGSLDCARHVFNQIPRRNLSVWNSMIGAVGGERYDTQVLVLFGKMVEEEGIYADAHTLMRVLPACARLEDVGMGKTVHAYLVKIGLAPNVFVGNCLVDMYVKCCEVESARRVFDTMPYKNVVSWNALITGYAKTGYGNECLRLFLRMKREGAEPDVISWTAVMTGFLKCGDALKAVQLFRQMQTEMSSRANAVTLVSVLQACASLAAMRHGKEIHAYAIRRGLSSALIVCNPLIDMYVKCGNMRDARLVFDRMLPQTQRDTVSWNTIISGYCKNGRCEIAVNLFHEMQASGLKPNAITWNAIITGFSQSGHNHEALEYLDQMQESGVKPDAVTWTSLIAGCIQNGHSDQALKLLTQMKMKQSSITLDLVLWTTVIAAYAQNGQCNEALKSFYQMQLLGIKPDSTSIINILPACARMAVLHKGKEVHNYILRNGFASDILVGNALIDMYAKCGSVDDARQVFNKMPRLDVVSWNTMIVGYAHHGLGEDALALFPQMKHSGIQPDETTFTGVITACCHAGLVDKGRQYFGLMEHEYHITPNLQHYACMVDLLCRSGHLDDAQIFITKMPLQPNACILGSLLGACRTHCNLALGEKVAKRLFELEPENEGNYVLLSNMYAIAGRWDDVAKVRRMMKNRGILKIGGCSWIEVKSRVHVFFAEDGSHP